MSQLNRLRAQVRVAARIIAPYWPIEQFIACNPLLDLQDLPFDQALERVRACFGGHSGPTRQMGQQALQSGEIDRKFLHEVLSERGWESRWEEFCRRPELLKTQEQQKSLSELDALLVKYLGAFLGAGKHSWSMPGCEQGFYLAWKGIAAFDARLPSRESITSLPDDPEQACAQLLADIPQQERVAYLEKQLAALPGYCGYIKYLESQNDQPSISLIEYLAVRLAIQSLLKADTEPVQSEGDPEEELAWLEAWERSYQHSLFTELQRAKLPPKSCSAQWVFCIDTRSEAMRRALEQQGAHETYGFAGFFGVPMLYHAAEAERAVAAYPALLEPQVEIREVPTDKEGSALSQIQRVFRQVVAAAKDLGKEPCASLAYIEVSGLLHGVKLAARTWWPRQWSNTWDRMRGVFGKQSASRLGLEPCPVSGEGMTLEQRCQIAETVLRSIGLTKNFAALVILCGHAARSSNNPYAASLHCGACGGNPGGANARVLAEILNQSQVRSSLRSRGIQIPEGCRFLAAEHDTTTDQLELLTPQHCMAPQREWLQAQMKQANERCSAMRLALNPHARCAKQRAVDWAETRPEWGLARNAAMIVAPRSFTYACDLDGRAFLHSYDYSSDPDGEVLAGIFSGPAIVAHWINMQYYFSTVDNAVFGSGSKVTQNVLGRAGVIQGNGSDLARGLPYQSLFDSKGRLYHQPLRLTLIVRAPRAHIECALERSESLKQLVDNEWLRLFVADPAEASLSPYYSEPAARREASALEVL